MTKELLTELREKIADIEHQQWWSWTLAISGEVPSEILKRWKKNWKPYKELNELEKNKDRKWADVILALITELIEKAKKWDDHEFLVVENEKGETQNIFHLEELAKAVEDRRKIEKRLEAVKNVLEDWWGTIDLLNRRVPNAGQIVALYADFCKAVGRDDLREKLRAAVKGEEAGK